MLSSVRVSPKAFLLACASLVLAFACSSAARAADHALRIYFVDVEGGQATLFITPAGKSLLIDTGFLGYNGRDADRIVAAAKDAGLSRIDYVLITHYHGDHVGGVPQLVDRIPVGTFIDHGPNREGPDVEGADITKIGWDAYQKILATGKYQHIVAKPGDMLPIAGLSVEAITADGNMISKPLPGAGAPNPYCKISAPRALDQTENPRSLGVLIRFGTLKILDLGDLTWAKEMQLMCPDNRIGRVDIWVVSHHGMNLSSSPALVDAIHSRVAIMDNAYEKGGSLEALQTIKKAPGLETLWQLHYSKAGAEAYNTAAPYIANLATQTPDQANYLELIAKPTGRFEIFNSRTKTAKSYPAR